MRAIEFPWRALMVAVSVSPSFCCGAEAPLHERADAGVVKEILNSSPEVRARIVTDLKSKRKTLISQLVSLVSSHNWRDRAIQYAQTYDPICVAAELLGEYRAVEAIPELISKKAMLVNDALLVPGQREAVPVINYFVLARALIRIGSPCLRGIEEELSGKPQLADLDIQLDAIILAEIEGLENAKGRLMKLERAAPSPLVQGRIKVANAFLQNYDKLKCKFDGQRLVNGK